jgi:hypothetical protein
MLRMATWWRSFGGLLAACVLALLVIAPTIAAAACVCDAPSAGATAQQMVSVADQKQDSGPCKAVCCLGGHCHYAGSVLDTTLTGVTAPVPKAAKPAMAPLQPLPSLTPSPLDHPPRA